MNKPKQIGTTIEYPTESYTDTSDCQCSNTDCPTIIRHVYVWPARPFTVNAANQNRWKWIEARAEWRDAYAAMARGSAPLAWCTITVDHLTGTRRNVDVAACLPSFKAALDGIVLAGVLADDCASIVRSARFNAPVFAGYDALIVTLDGCAT